ncbi:peptidase C39 family protein [Nocardioides sp. JQ2195]|uniref:C39 family peptidase n=1 Tax=Nocardioides sp. JQ2195 TaxID=2592334 RepID=UPI00143E20C7|nr:C39 family peptidase [Nocardioides sp. JQ2195]QIX25649.1 peptidase C39 family protein [Nocardioides sp. JQ2195]
MDFPRSRSSRIAVQTAVLLLAGSLSTAAVAPAGAAPGPRVAVQAQKAPSAQVLTKRWSSTKNFNNGTKQGITVRKGSMRIGDAPRRTRVRDPFADKPARTMDYARWVSPWKAVGFDATNVIPSWNARAPRGTFVRINIRTRSATGTSSWDRVADWTHAEQGMHRHSGGAQTDDLNKLLTDTLVSQGTSRIRAVQVRLTLLRPAGSTTTPVLDSAGFVAASFTSRTPATSPTTMTARTRLDVPKFSQMTHQGHYPQWDNGGEAWCSPTSTAMVLRYYGTGPSPADYAWTGETDGQVDHAARYAYDYSYQGAGNWPFNTAYAGSFGTDAFVTRLMDLRGAERLIRKGIPVVTSIAFSRGGLDGSPLTSTPGHLVVIVGFTADGRVIVNDPAAPENSTVRRTYRRDQFERAWLGGSGGVAYVVRAPR